MRHRAINGFKLLIFDLDDTLYPTPIRRSPASAPIDGIVPFPGVPDLIKAVRARGASIAIVTTGEFARQKRKIALLGLGELVDAVFICQKPEGKLALFKRCLARFGAHAHETLVVGDRIDREISFGNALGCVTVRLLQGKHRKMVPRKDGEFPTFTIYQLDVLRLWFTPWLDGHAVPKPVPTAAIARVKRRKTPRKAKS